jgi:hypothetical protein
VTEVVAGHVVHMSNDIPKSPDPEVDQHPSRAPGGVDAHVSESDVGGASRTSPVTPDAPLSAQQDDADLPDEILTPEEPEPEVPGDDDDSPSEPSA